MVEPFVVPRTETWLHDDLRVAVALPQHIDGPLPVLLVLDGHTMFLTAAEYSRTVTLVTMGALPPVAVVGVWREMPTALDYLATRFRDFTPYKWVLPGPFAADNALARFGTGGAPHLLDAITERVLPAVRERVTIGEVAIGGWSLSGLFAAWAWRERPDLFTHLLAMTPSLWWADGRMLHEPLGRRDGSRAFISAGEREEGDMALVWPQLFANAGQREFAAMVRNTRAFGEMCDQAGATTETVVLPDEHHVTLVPASLARGLRHLFATS